MAKRATKKRATKRPAGKTKSAAKKKSTPSKLARAADAAVKRQLAKGEAALALIARRMGVIKEAFYDIGVALQILQRKAVYSALGAQSFEALVDERTELSHSVAWELARLPVHLSREAAIHVSQEKASAIIRYVRATPEEDFAEAMALDHAPIAGKLASEHTATSIDEAARSVRRADPGRVSEEEQAAIDAAGHLEREIERATNVDVTARAVRRGGQWQVRIEIPPTVASKLRVRR